MSAPMAKDTFKNLAFPILVAVGPICSQLADGARVHKMIEVLLNQGYSVTLDFHDVKIVTQEFYDALIGDLHVTFPEPRLTAINIPIGQCEPS
jgi:ribulose bisphosphate carboxylase small subunit